MALDGGLSSDTMVTIKKFTVKPPCQGIMTKELVCTNKTSCMNRSYTETFLILFISGPSH
jgi:hypothetical protein